MHGLETVAHVREGAPHNHAHRVVEVRPLHLELQIDLLDLVVREIDFAARDLGLGSLVRGLCYISHGDSPLRPFDKLRSRMCRSLSLSKRENKIKYRESAHLWRFVE